MSEEGQEVEVIDADSEHAAAATMALAPTDTAELERVLLGGEMAEFESNPELIQQQIVERILRAQTLDEILASFEATPLKDVLGRAFEIVAVKWQRSEYEEGNPFYAVFDAVMIDDGEKVALTTGATNVLAQVLALSKGGHLPTKVVASQASKPTKSGYYPLRLERAQ